MSVMPRERPLLKTAKQPNLVTFPRALRDAIPAEPTMAGRVLHLSTIDAKPSHTYRGRRVQLRLTAEESGKLTGRFPILMDFDLDSARCLAATLMEIAGRAEQLERGPGW
jgi:hypothetical protein